MWKDEYQFRFDNLKQENLELKKKVNNIVEANNILKVRYRKLETECRKKDKHIYTLMDPKNSKLFNQHMCENGVDFIFRLKNENEKLKKKLLEKDIIIKRLNSELKASNTYTTTYEKRKLNLETNYKDVETECQDSLVNEKFVNYNSESETYNSEEFLDTRNQENAMYQNISLNQIIKSLKCKELDKLYTNLQKIRENCDFSLKDDMQQECNNNKAIIKMLQEAKREDCGMDNLILKSNKHFSKHAEFTCDTPHEEIQKLQNYFMEMFTKVDDLKLVISHLQTEQEKTSNLLFNQGTNIEKLEDKIKTTPGKDKIKSGSKLKRKKSFFDVDTVKVLFK